MKKKNQKMCVPGTARNTPKSERSSALVVEGASNYLRRSRHAFQRGIRSMYGFRSEIEYVVLPATTKSACLCYDVKTTQH